MSQTILGERRRQNYFQNWNFFKGNKWRRIIWACSIKWKYKRGRRILLTYYVWKMETSHRLWKAWKISLNNRLQAFWVFEVFFPTVFYFPFPFCFYFVYWSQPHKLKAFKEYLSSKEHSHEYVWEKSSKKGRRRQNRLQTSEVRNSYSHLSV